jgi:hypothetical protein
MNAVFKACLLALLLLIALSSLVHADNLPAPTLTDSKYSFLTTRTGDHFEMRYNPNTVSGIPEVASMVMKAQDDIDRLFGEYIHYTTIVIAGTNSEFGLFINVGDAPDTARALNWNAGYNGLIVIKSPAMIADFKQALVHQMARIAVRSKMNTTYQSMPEWYQDGVASFIAGDLTQAQRGAMMIKATTGKWKSLNELEQAYKNMTIYNYDEQEYRDARAQAAVLVDDIGARFGGKKLVAIIDDYKGDGNVTGAFIKETTFTPEEMSLALMNMLAGNTAASPSPGPIAGGTNTSQTGTSPSPTASPTSAPTAAPTDQVTKYVNDSMPEQAAGGWSLPSTGNMILDALIVTVNAAGIISVVLILRRNWH